MMPYGLIGGVVAALGAAVYIFMLREDIAVLERDHAILKANQITLEQSIEEQKDAIKVAQDLHQKEIERSNDHFKALQTAQNNYIGAIQDNQKLTIKLNGALENAPYTAAVDGSNRLNGLLAYPWLRKNNNNNQGADSSGLPGGANAGTGSEAEGSETSGN